MNTYEWAKNELNLARENEIAQCKKKNDYHPGDEDYGIMCYDAVEQLLNVFEEQGHSGYSAMVVKEIFSRLVDGKPLTPIKDEEDQWIEVSNATGVYKKYYQHKRMSSLFKRIKADDTVSYFDTDRIRAYNGDNIPFFNGLVDNVVDEYFPIKFPYVGEKIKVRINDTDISANHSEIRHIIDATRNDLEHVFIDRYFMATDDTDWQEIDVFTYRDIVKNNIKEENNNG